MSRTRIKLCGMTRDEDVALAVALEVDYIGLIFAARSPRKLTLDRATALRALVPSTTAVVALFMDNPPAEVDAVVSRVRPDVLQFHGGEDDAFAGSFHRPFWKAIAMGGQEGGAFASLAAYPNASGFLFDGHAAGEQGGSGQRFDWRQMPEVTDRPCLLAGGLSPDNVGLALRTAHPWGVDVSSGIETAPGEKDPEKMRRFVDAVRIADTRG